MKRYPFLDTLYNKYLTRLLQVCLEKLETSGFQAVNINVVLNIELRVLLVRDELPGVRVRRILGSLILVLEKKLATHLNSKSTREHALHSILSRLNSKCKAF